MLLPPIPLDYTSQNLLMESITISLFWNNTCQSAQSHAMLMSNHCSEPFRELIQHETKKLISQNPPTTNAELQQLNAQSMQLSTKISSISHASSMVCYNPEVVTEIYNATKSFCDENVLTSDCCLPSIELSTQISQFCHTVTMKRINGR